MVLSWRYFLSAFLITQVLYGSEVDPASSLISQDLTDNLVSKSTECKQTQSQHPVKKKEECAPAAKKVLHPFSIKARVAAFFPQSDTMRKIYGNVWPEYSLEFDYRFLRHLAVFGNTGAYFEHGHSLGLNNGTDATVVPITAGLNYFFGKLTWWYPYVGAGLGAAYVKFTDHSSFVEKHTHEWGLATFVQAGMEFDLSCHFFFDLFTSYRYNWIHFDKVDGVTRHDVNTGGWQIGGGLGARW